jgi:ABC-type uncharacterized transport system substrate-binding protein
MTQHVRRWVLSVLLVALSVPAAAQQPQSIPRVGYLSTRPAEMEQILLPAFLHGLRELGYTEGKNLVIERRYAAEGQHDRLRELVAELVRLKVDVIAVIGPDATAVAKAATTTIPIVFINSPDPVGLGLVESLARPRRERHGADGLSWPPGLQTAGAPEGGRPGGVAHRLSVDGREPHGPAAMARTPGRGARPGRDAPRRRGCRP